VHGIQSLEVCLDTHLVVSQLNKKIHICDPMLGHFFLQVRLLEHYFDYITYVHVPRYCNSFCDAFANYVLDWHLYNS
jgi:hypothetical protein